MGRSGRDPGVVGESEASALEDADYVGTIGGARCWFKGAHTSFYFGRVKAVDPVAVDSGTFVCGVSGRCGAWGDADAPRPARTARAYSVCEK